MAFFHLLAHLVVQDVESTQMGTTRKIVNCELCGKDYSYSLSRTAKGHATNFLFGQAGHAAASVRAQASLARVLEKAGDPVPCPICGWYQKDMVLRARTLRYRWMNRTGLVLFPLSILLAVGAFIAWGMEEKAGVTVPFFTFLLLTMAGLAGILAPGLPLLKYCLSCNYDPNSAPQQV